MAQPWWDERARRLDWERYQAGERRRREEARLQWEREHGPYRR